MVYETITNIDQLIKRVQSYNPDAETDLVRRAYAFSAKAHEGQTRQSGEPYLQHPLAVAGVLTSLRSDVTAIVAGLLHDTLEDTVATPGELEHEFGKEILRLVDGVTKIGKIRFRNYEEKQAENFRKMLLAMARDIRVILVKLADRTHNMRTLGHLKPERQIEIAHGLNLRYADRHRAATDAAPRAEAPRRGQHGPAGRLGEQIDHVLRPRPRIARNRHVDLERGGGERKESVDLRHRTRSGDPYLLTASIVCLKQIVKRSLGASPIRSSGREEPCPARRRTARPSLYRWRPTGRNPGDGAGTPPERARVTWRPGPPGLAGKRVVS